MTEPNTLSVRAIKAVLDDDGRRVVTGFMAQPIGEGRWWCETCRGSRCAHVLAVAEHAAAALEQATR